MTGHIPEHIIAKVQAATDIVGLISQYVPLEKRGRNFLARCPFHEEKTPSFTVSAEKQLFYCFGCKQGGSAARFLMLHERMTFPEAIRFLASAVGIHIPESPGADPRKEEEARSERAALYTLLEMAASFYVSQLQSPAGARAREYVRGRQISTTMAEVWKLGFAPGSWDSLCQHFLRQGTPANLLEKAGLASPREKGNGQYDRFRNRLMFPIWDVRERIVGFGARALTDEDQPKYLNSPETSLFDKSACLYGIHRAHSEIRKRACAVVVEGYTDVLMAHQFGVTHVVATLGTALTRKHIQFLRRYAPRVVLVYDADAAGEKASDRGVELFLQEDVDVSVATLSPGLDPCDFLLQEGPRAFEDRLHNALDILHFKLQQVRAKYDLDRMDQNARATDEVLALVPKIANEVKRDLYLQRAAGELRIPENTLRARAASLQRPQRTPGRPAAPAAGPELSRGAARTAQNDIIEFLMKAPAESGDVFHDVSPEDFPDPPYRRIYITIRDLREGDGQVDPAAVLHTLESRSPGSSEAGLVAEILAADCENLAERARGSLAWFSKQRRQKEVSTLKQQLKEAQSRGDTASVRQLLEQVRSLSGPALEGAASSR